MIKIYLIFCIHLVITANNLEAPVSAGAFSMQNFKLKRSINGVF